MLCSRSSVDSDSHLASARVKDKELYLLNFSSTVKQTPGLNRAKPSLDSKADNVFFSVWDTYGLKCKEIRQSSSDPEHFFGFPFPFACYFGLKPVWWKAELYYEMFTDFAVGSQRCFWGQLLSVINHYATLHGGV